MTRQGRGVEVDGAELRRLRRQAAMEVGEFAVACGMSRSHVSNIENGNRRVSLAHLRRMADVLAVHPARLSPDVSLGIELTSDARVRRGELRRYDTELVTVTLCRFSGEILADGEVCSVREQRRHADERCAQTYVNVARARSALTGMLDELPAQSRRAMVSAP